MLHAICFLSNFLTAFVIATKVHDQHRATGNYLFVGGMLIICLLIVLDYIAERLKHERQKRRSLRTNRKPQPVKTFRTSTK